MSAGNSWQGAGGGLPVKRNGRTPARDISNHLNDLWSRAFRKSGFDHRARLREVLAQDLNALDTRQTCLDQRQIGKDCDNGRFLDGNDLYLMSPPLPRRMPPNHRVTTTATPSRFSRSMA
jgi:hypothetical protein